MSWWVGWKQTGPETSDDVAPTRVDDDVGTTVVVVVVVVGEGGANSKELVIA